MNFRLAVGLCLSILSLLVGCAGVPSAAIQPTMPPPPTATVSPPTATVNSPTATALAQQRPTPTMTSTASKTPAFTATAASYSVQCLQLLA